MRSLTSSLLGSADEEVQHTAEALLVELRRLELATRRPAGAGNRPPVPTPETTVQLRFVTGDELDVGPEGFESITLDRDALERVFQLQQRVVEWIGSDQDRAAQFGQDPVGTLERLGLADPELLTALRRERAAQESAVVGQEPEVAVTFRAGPVEQS